MVGTRKLALTVPYLVCLAAAAIAGETPTLPAGTPVRITAPLLWSRPLTGTLAATTEDEIVLALSTSERKAIPRSAVTRLEWSRVRRHPIAGAVVGAVVVGALVAVVSAYGCTAENCEPTPAMGFLTGAALGALPGAGIGALVKTRDWAKVAPSLVQVSLAPARGRGVAMQVTLRF